MTNIQPQTIAPNFTLLDQESTPHTLSAYIGSWVLIYFYPKDDTPGCTKQACGLRDAFPDFSSLNIKIFGISPDTVQRHKKFSEKYALPFTLLADEGHRVAELYGAWGPKKFMGRTYDGVSRTSLLIDPEGKIAKVYEKVKPDKHAQDILTDLKEFGA